MINSESMPAMINVTHITGPAPATDTIIAVMHIVKVIPKRVLPLSYMLSDFKVS